MLFMQLRDSLIVSVSHSRIVSLGDSPNTKKTDVSPIAFWYFDIGLVLTGQLRQAPK